MILEHLSRLNSKTVILASQSPRRREILTLMGLQFTPQPSRFEESLPHSQFPNPQAYVIANAQGKALDVANTNPDHHLIIGSDTVVVQDGKILEKPRSEGEAFQMLRALSGRPHTVYTGVSLVAKGCEPRNFCEETKVWFTQLSDEMIATYVKTGEPMDKAGAYGIQGRGALFVNRIEGCYFAVMGLPIHALAKEIARLCEDNLL